MSCACCLVFFLCPSCDSGKWAVFFRLDLREALDIKTNVCFYFGSSLTGLTINRAVFCLMMWFLAVWMNLNSYWKTNSVDNLQKFLFFNISIINICMMSVRTLIPVIFHYKITGSMSNIWCRAWNCISTQTFASCCKGIWAKCLERFSRFNKREFQLNNSGVKLEPLATQKADGSRKLKYFPLLKRYAMHLRNTETWWVSEKSWEWKQKLKCVWWITKGHWNSLLLFKQQYLHFFLYFDLNPLTTDVTCKNDNIMVLAP